MKCPKCGYLRTPKDEAPDYECPKCGVIYAKVASRFQETKSEIAEPASVNVRRVPSKVTIIAILVVLALVSTFAYRHHQDEMRREALVAAERAALAASKAAEEAAQVANTAAKQKRDAEVADAAMRVQRMSLRLTEAVRLASSTARVALSGPVASLQALHREVLDMNVPECFAESKEHLGASAGLYVDAFLAFMSDTGFDGRIKSSQLQTKAIEHEIERVKLGNPPRSCQST